MWNLLMHTHFDTISYGYLSVRKDLHMNKHNQKHLTLSDRIYIEQELCQGSSFRAIASSLDKDPTTISKESRKHRKEFPGRYYSGNCRYCKFWDNCTIQGNDLEVSACSRSKYCAKYCKRCWYLKPQHFCTAFVPLTCKTITSAPYVCNGRDKERKCRLDHYIYTATTAQKHYETELTKSRVGINMTQEELQSLNDLISPLILKGLPLSHIFAVHADEIPV